MISTLRRFHLTQDSHPCINQLLFVFSGSTTTSSQTIAKNLHLEKTLEELNYATSKLSLFISSCEICQNVMTLFLQVLLTQEHTHLLNNFQTLKYVVRAKRYIEVENQLKITGENTIESKARYHSSRKRCLIILKKHSKSITCLAMSCLRKEPNMNGSYKVHIGQKSLKNPVYFLIIIFLITCI